VLIPARLIEPRYFTVPWMLLQLHAGFGSSRAHVLAPLYLFAFVNAATLYLFLCRSYTWPDGSTARFMW
jgi:alpha-1,2-glucosyltransferase